jgi:nucleoid DNA-binding protein
MCSKIWLFNKAKSNPIVRQQAKKLVKTGLSKASSAVKKQASKRGVDNPLVDMAINAATKKANSEIDKHLGSGRRMRINGFGTQGVRMSGRMSGRGHCSGGAMVIPGRRGSGMYAPHFLRG